MTNHIATTRARDLQSLAAGGQLVTDSWAILVPLLRQRLGPAHAALLAEPLTNPTQGETDWYAEGNEPARPLASLPPELQAQIRQTLAQLGADIAALAGTLKSGRDGNDRVLGTMLELALQVPGEGYVYAAGTQPVLVAWGHAGSGGASQGIALSGQRAAAPGRMAILPPPMVPPPAVRRLGPALAAATLGAALLLVAALLLLGRDPLGWYAVAAPVCAVPDGNMALRAQLDGAARHEAELRLQLAQLSTDAGARRLQCPPVQLAAVPPPVPPRPIPQPAPTPPSEDSTRAQRRGGQRGKLTIILAWDDRNDLDLFVRCPDGATIYYKRRSACGGTLDVDANENASTADVQPVENVFFPQPQGGTYTVVVDAFAMRVSTETPFRVTIQQEGQPDRVVNGVAHNGQHMQEVTTVTLEASP